MKDWSSHNKKVFSIGLNKYREGLEMRIVNVLTELAQSVIVYVEGSGQLPIYTGNLADSTGVGVYRNGHLTSYLPTKRAIVPQEYEGQTVWGDEELMNALQMSATEFSSGIWIVLFSAVPYAFKLEKKYNYFDDGIVEDMMSEFRTLVSAEFPNDNHLR